MIYLIVGSSGSGKTTQANILRKRDNFFRIITYTTRAPRKGEINEVDYFFVDRETFLKLKKENFFLEVTEYSNNYYGTPKLEIQKYINSDKNAVLVVDLNGVKKIKEEFKNSICIYLKLDEAALVERMNARGDSINKIEDRLKAAQDFTPYANYILDASKSVSEISREISEIVDRTQK